MFAFNHLAAPIAWCKNSLDSWQRATYRLFELERGVCRPRRSRPVVDAGPELESVLVGSAWSAPTRAPASRVSRGPPSASKSPLISRIHHLMTQIRILVMNSSRRCMR